MNEKEKQKKDKSAPDYDITKEDEQESQDSQ